jgi:hypothetical protein
MGGGAIQRSKVIRCESESRKHFQPIQPIQPFQPFQPFQPLLAEKAE